MGQLTQTLVHTQQANAKGSSIQGSTLQHTAVTPIHNPTLQRCSNGVECLECRQKRIEREGTLQRTAVNSAPTPTSAVSPTVHSSLNSPSQALDGGTQAFTKPRFGYDFSRIPVHFSHPPELQTKLTVNQPGDVYEQEADHVAEQVMRATNPIVSVPEDEDETKKSLMRKQGSKMGEHGTTDTSSVPLIVHDVLNSGGGQPLDAGTRAFMEPRFGYDFSRVRIHTDARAAESARAVNALAYTVGRDVVFGEGQYVPGTSEGRRLVAHELTHVVQQDKTSRTLQNFPDIVKNNHVYEKYSINHIDRVLQENNTLQPSIQYNTQTLQRQDNEEEVSDEETHLKGSGCSVPTSTPYGPLSAQVSFNFDSADISKGKAAVADFMKKSGGASKLRNIRVDGYASSEGKKAYNIVLSCRRAKAVKRELSHTYGIAESSIDVFAHGPTSEFSNKSLAANRIVLITADIGPAIAPSTPTPAGPAASSHVCGPDVSSEVQRIWSQIQSDFDGWSFGQKEASCLHLILPIIPGSGGNIVLNENAFDTIGLFQGSARWTRELPYHPPCGEPGTSAPPGADDFDIGHEDSHRCSNSVQIGNECWLSGTANYGTFGIMMKLCYDWTTPLVPLPGFSVLNDLFSPLSLATLVAGYKTYKGDDPTLPVRWAMATYMGGPGAQVSGGNRAHCKPTCPVPLSKRFNYVWEPTKPRK